MVCRKILIVDVELATANNSAALCAIKDKPEYAGIAQLFHFRKSHHVHLIGPATAAAAMTQAENDVYAAMGEPLHLTPEDESKLLSIVRSTPDKFARAIENAVTFREGERFARDDKTRMGWRRCDPIYGVCAATYERRRELMGQCIAAINSRCTLDLTLISRDRWLNDGLKTSVVDTLSKTNHTIFRVRRCIRNLSPGQVNLFNPKRDPKARVLAALQKVCPSSTIHNLELSFVDAVVYVACEVAAASEHDARILFTRMWECLETVEQIGNPGDNVEEFSIPDHLFANAADHFGVHVVSRTVMDDCVESAVVAGLESQVAEFFAAIHHLETNTSTHDVGQYSPGQQDLFAALRRCANPAQQLTCLLSTTCSVVFQPHESVEVIGLQLLDDRAAITCVARSSEKRAAIIHQAVGECLETVEQIGNPGDNVEEFSIPDHLFANAADHFGVHVVSRTVMDDCVESAVVAGLESQAAEFFAAICQIETNTRTHYVGQYSPGQQDLFAALRRCANPAQQLTCLLSTTCSVVFQPHESVEVIGLQLLDDRAAITCVARSSEKRAAIIHQAVGECLETVERIGEGCDDGDCGSRMRSLTASSLSGPASRHHVCVVACNMRFDNVVSATITGLEWQTLEFLAEVLL